MKNRIKQTLQKCKCNDIEVKYRRINRYVCYYETEFSFSINGDIYYSSIGCEYNTTDGEDGKNEMLEILKERVEDEYKELQNEIDSVSKVDPTEQIQEALQEIKNLFPNLEITKEDDFINNKNVRHIKRKNHEMCFFTWYNTLTIKLFTGEVEFMKCTFKNVPFKNILIDNVSEFMIGRLHIVERLNEKENRK